MASRYINTYIYRSYRSVSMVSVLLDLNYGFEVYTPYLGTWTLRVRVGVLPVLANSMVAETFDIGIVSDTSSIPPLKLLVLCCLS